MDQTVLERIAKLEVRVETVETTVKGMDGKLDTIINSVNTWQSNQKGFITGVTLIGGIVWTLLTFSWDKVLKYLGGGSS